MAISDRIQSMYEHVEDIYDSVELTGVDTTDIDKNLVNVPNTLKEGYIDIINNGTDTLYDNFPKVSGEGTSLTLNNTYQAPMRNLLKGNTYQTQYSGKNLLPPTIATETKDGITLTNNGDGSYTLTGTYSTSTTFDMALPATLNGTYSFSGNNPTAGKNIQFRILASSGSSLSTYLNNVNKTVENKTIENGTKQSIRIVGPFTSGFTCKPQLESGSTATSYEPYVGGVAKPSPTSPIPVNVVSGDNEIFVNGKNWFDKDNTQWYRNNVAIFEKTLDTSTTRIRTNSFRIQGGKTYTISGIPSGISFLTVRTYNVPSGESTEHKTVSGNTFTLQDDVNYIHLLFGGENFTSATNTLMANANIMINEGSSALPYEPYQGNTYNIDLPVENIYKVDNITTTTKNGVTYSVENEVITLNGTVSSGFDINLSSYYPLEAGTYTISCQVISGSYTGTIGKYVRKPSGSGYTILIDGSSLTATRTVTVNESNENTYSALYLVGGAVCNNLKVSIQLEKGSKANTYTPYGTTPIELCSSPDGTKRDGFIHDKTTDKWYLHKEIGKYTFTGNDSFEASAYGTNSWDLFNVITIPFDTTKLQVICNLFKGIPHQDRSTGGNNVIYSIAPNNGGIEIRNTSYSTLAQIQSATNGNYVYYILATPTNTEITYQPLIEQLNAIEQAQSKENQTNISQINNDLPFIINASALKKGDTIENNSASLLMSFGGLPNTNGEEETPDFEEDVSDVEEETPIEESIEEEIGEEPVEEETDEEPVEEETEIEEEGE